MKTLEFQSIYYPSRASDQNEQLERNNLNDAAAAKAQTQNRFNLCHRCNQAYRFSEFVNLLFVAIGVRWCVAQATTVRAHSITNITKASG